MIVWVLFLCMITVFLALDLGIFNREAHEISYKEATKWTIAWSTLGVLFSGMIYLIYSNQWIEISAHQITIGSGYSISDRLYHRVDLKY